MQLTSHWWLSPPTSEFVSEWCIFAGCHQPRHANQTLCQKHLTEQEKLSWEAFLKKPNSR